MNLSASDQSVHHSTEGRLEDDKHSVMLPCLRRNIYDEPLAPYSSGSIISQLLRKTIHNSKRVLDESQYYLSNTNATDSGQEDRSSVSSKDSTVEASSPNGHISVRCSPEAEHPMTDHLQAKRARVENIIRVMAGSPNSRQHGDNERPDADGRDTRECREAYRENKRKQRLPQHQEHSIGGPATRKSRNDDDDTNTKDEECHKLKEQLHSMQKLLRQLQEKILQVYNQGDADHDQAGTIDCDTLTESADDAFDRKKSRVILEGEDRIKVVGHLAHQRENQNLREILKQELSRAVNECVDRVLTKVSTSGLDLSSQQRMCPSPDMQISSGTGRKNQSDSSTHEQLQAEEGSVKTHSLEYYENSDVHQDQTEALSLVVRKPVTSPLSSVTSTVKRPYPVHQTPFQFNYNTPLHDSQILEHLLKYGPHSNFAGLHCMPHSMDRTSPDPVDLPWETIALRSKVTPGHLSHHPRPSALGPVTVDNLCLPHVKLECGELQSVAERNPYMSLNIQEGLTPSHLKKAKLMFFYTRYPSSNVLKTFFPDVKCGPLHPNPS
uniref:prospero homeobox protein 2 isoform X2 n=1 Tax=Doryrhamphus excisus TaxID=161450 RepID=UPI0025AE7ACC|nr:prospero homeobox protein 2 isoform X2 [Doryrhamphus excisus]